MRHHAPLPWKKIFFVVALVFFTGLSSLFQDYGQYFLGSILGQPKPILEGIPCPPAGFDFEVSPIPGLFSYIKGDSEANRRELLRINKKNYGLTSWLSYDKSFDEAAKAKLIDQIAYERSPNQYAVLLYESIKNDKSPHAAVDLVTKWLSPDQVNLPTVFPYSAGSVVDAVSGNIGYGNYVSVCSELIDSSGKKLKVLYNVAHLDSLSVTQGQLVKAGDELGKIGSTGKSTTPHAHIVIMPELLWMEGYRDVYNGGYKFYYPENARETLVKTIDPISVILNPDMAYSIVLDDNKRKQIFENTEVYLSGLANTLAFGGASIVLNEPAPLQSSKILSSFRVSAVPETVRVGEWVSMVIDALDQNGQLSPSFLESLNVVLSSPTAVLKGNTTLQQGSATFQVSDTKPGEFLVQVSNHGSISAEKKVRFEDQLSLLQVLAPQKTLLGTPVTVTLKPLGIGGEILSGSFSVQVTVFPFSGESNSSVVPVSNGRGEYLFSADQEGIFQLSFQLGNLTEKIQITVEKPATPTSEPSSLQPSIPAISSSIPSVSAPSPQTKKPSQILLKEGSNYRIYERSDSTYIVYNDNGAETNEYPVELQFTVPKKTTAISVFSGLSPKAFPEGGELKLSKFKKGQEVVRYFPKHTGEENYKKIVTYSDGEAIDEKVLVIAPASFEVFTDVVKGFTDEETYQAVKALKKAQVVKGNPDGSYGVEKPLNRASAATLIIRAFYSDIKLEDLKITRIKFKDVPKQAWFAPPIWFASEDQFQGEKKPVILKGSKGLAFPDGSVKLEEFVTMILRVLEIKIPSTNPWYEGSIQKAIEKKLISADDRSLIDKPLSRGMVAKILVRGLQLSEGQEITVTAPVSEPIASPSPSPVVAPATSPTPEPVGPAPVQTPAPKPPLTSLAENFRAEIRDHDVTLYWDSAFEGVFRISVRSADGTPNFIGSTQEKSFHYGNIRDGETLFFSLDGEGISLPKLELQVKK